MIHDSRAFNTKLHLRDQNFIWGTRMGNYISAKRMHNYKTALLTFEAFPLINLLGNGCQEQPPYNIYFHIPLLELYLVLKGFRGFI